MANEVIRYETEPCGRCGGSGRYSYNQMTGDRCFKCDGRKTQLTVRSIRARRKVDAFKATLIETRFPIDLKPGDRILASGPTRGASTVVSVEDCPSLLWTSKVGDVETSGHFVQVQLKNAISSFASTSQVPLALSAENRAKVIEFARPLAGVVIQ